ncbi:hypothetical protein [Streptococcus vestibularis]|uniref:hypothetical protein n=1 Tax=Streptococcus vestibularis TaxID=1343 RepID=UPI0026F1FEF4|nr:hypothetical protein [Streptococcus vestibularis]
MDIGILYLSMSFIYILFVCLDEEDVKPKWKQWLADKLGIKPKIEVRYIESQVVKLHSRVAISNFETQYYGHNKSRIEQLKKRATECVYEEILKEMKVNNLVSISQYKDFYSNNIIYEGTCSIYKKIASYGEI